MEGPEPADESVMPAASVLVLAPAASEPAPAAFGVGHLSSVGVGPAACGAEQLFAAYEVSAYAFEGASCCRPCPPLPLEEPQIASASRDKML